MNCKTNSCNRCLSFCITSKSSSRKTDTRVLGTVQNTTQGRSKLRAFIQSLDAVDNNDTLMKNNGDDEINRNKNQLAFVVQFIGVD